MHTAGRLHQSCEFSHHPDRSVTAAELPELTRDELQRYSRHLSLPSVGTNGQRRLKAARVLIVGAGGLGSPTALYLAAAGVGTIGLVDFDVVDVTNLQRQILHGTTRRGSPQARLGARRGCTTSIRMCSSSRTTCG